MGRWAQKPEQAAFTTSSEADRQQPEQDALAPSMVLLRENYLQEVNISNTEIEQERHFHRRVTQKMGRPQGRKVTAFGGESSKVAEDALLARAHLVEFGKPDTCAQPTWPNLSFTATSPPLST